MTTALFSIRRYTGTGSAQVLATPPLLSPAHLRVTINGTETAAYTWVTSGTISLTAPAGSIVELSRATSPSERVVDFQGAVPLTEADLDMDSLQALYLAQEALDRAADYANGKVLPAGVLNAGDVFYLSNVPGAQPTTVKLFLDLTVHAGTVGVVGDGTTDDTSKLQAALTNLGGTGKYLDISGMECLISQALVVPTRTGIVSDGTGSLKASAAGFLNTDPETRRTTASAMVIFSGQLSSPWTPNRDQKLRNVVLNGNRQEGRVLDGVVATNCENLQITGCRFHNFPLGYGIRAGTLSGDSIIAYNLVEDFYSNTVFPGYGFAERGSVNITGIDIDDERVGATPVGSYGVKVLFNVVRNLGHGPAATAVYLDQTDGIQLQNGGSHYLVLGNDVSGTNEGIDIYARYSTIVGNFFRDNSGWGIKLIHGASHNRIIGNNVARSGLANIVLAGGILPAAGALGPVQFNTVAHNVFDQVDAAGLNAASTTSNIRVEGRPLTAPEIAAGQVANFAQNNTFTGNVLKAGGAKWNIFVEGSGSLSENFGNVFDRPVIEQAGSVGRFSEAVAANGANELIPQRPTRVRAVLGSDQSIPNGGVYTQVNLSVETFDTKGEFNNATYTWTCVEPGYYRVAFQARMSAGTGLLLAVRRNGTNSILGGYEATTGSQTAQVSDLVYCAAGDTLTFHAAHLSAGPQSLTSGPQYTRAFIERA